MSDEGGNEGTGRERYAEVVKRIQKLPLDCRVLDVGFGAALLPELAACDWYGLEISPRLVANARERGLNAHVCDCDEAWRETPSDYYDAVVLMNVLEHVENPQHVLREAKRVLKSKGVVVGTVPYSVNLKRLFYERASFEKLKRVFTGFDDIRVYGKNELVFSLLREGLEPVVVKRVCRHLPLLRVELPFTPFLAVSLYFEALKK